MARRQVWILRTASIWVFYVMAVLVRNTIVDRIGPLAFRMVPMGLAIGSFVLATASLRKTIFISNEINVRLRIIDLAPDAMNSNLAQ